MTDVNEYQAGLPSWVDVMSPEPEKARQFYSAVFGWTFDVGPPEAGFYSMAKVRNRLAAGVGPIPQNMKMPSVWNVYFDTKDVDATIAKIKQRGGNVIMGPMDVLDSGRLAMATDPTGAVFGLWQPRSHKGAQVRNETGASVWHEVVTRDVAKAKDFYPSIFDLSVEKMPGEMEYYVFKRGKEMVAGAMQMDKSIPANVPPNWMNYFGVDDTDAAVKRVTSNGGKVMMPAQDSPYGRFAIVADPFGATFAVIKPSNPG
jgi:predicted enzyme related to lactoylglutathione lyase